MNRWYGKAAILGAVLMITGLSLGAILYKLEPGGVMQDAIVGYDPYMAQHEVVAREMWGSDVWVFARVGEFNEAAVKDYRRFGKLVERRMPDARDGLADLSTLPKPEVDPDGTVSFYPYFKPQGESDNLEAIKQNLQLDTIMKGVLFSNNLDILYQIVILPQDFSQRRVYDGAVSVIEQRNIGDLEWLWNYWIKPTAENVAWKILSWVAGREVIGRMLPLNMFLFASLGLITVGCIVRYCSGSWLVGWVSVLLMVTSLLWMLASIPLIDHFTLFKFRPYIIIAAALDLVTGSSFTLLKTYHLRATTREERRTIGAFAIITIFMGLGNQYSLFVSFNIRAICELAVYGTVAYLTVAGLVWWVMPILLPKIPTDTERDNAFVRSVKRLAVRIEGRQPSQRAALAITIVSLIGAIVAFPFIPRGSNPLDFIRHTFPERCFEFVRARGGWVDGLATMVRPTHYIPELWAAGHEHNPVVTNDPRFLADVAALVDRVEAQSGGRVTAITKAMKVLSRGLYGHEPRTEAEAQAVFRYLEDSPLKYGLKRSQYTNRALQIFTVSGKIENSADVRELRSTIEELAQEFPGLRIDFGGQSALYALVDSLVIVGKLWNIGTQISWNYFGYTPAVWLLSWLFLSFGYRCGRVSALKMSAVMGIPFIFATAGFTIIMAVCQIRLDQANAAILNMANNAAGDFVMYFAGKFMYEIMKLGDVEAALAATFAYKGEQVIEDVLLNAACFAFLLLGYASGYKTIGELGWQTPVMLGLCAIGTLYIMPPFLKWTVVDGSLRKPTEALSREDVPPSTWEAELAWSPV